MSKKTKAAAAARRKERKVEPVVDRPSSAPKAIAAAPMTSPSSEAASSSPSSSRKTSIREGRIKKHLNYCKKKSSIRATTNTNEFLKAFIRIALEEKEKNNIQSLKDKDFLERLMGNSSIEEKLTELHKKFSAEKKAENSEVFYSTTRSEIESLIDAVVKKLKLAEAVKSTKAVKATAVSTVVVRASAAEVASAAGASAAAAAATTAAAAGAAGAAAAATATTTAASATAASGAPTAAGAAAAAAAAKTTSTEPLATGAETALALRSAELTESSLARAPRERSALTQRTVANQRISDRLFTLAQEALRDHQLMDKVIQITLTDSRLTKDDLQYVTRENLRNGLIALTRTRAPKLLSNVRDDSTITATALTRTEIPRESITRILSSLLLAAEQIIKARGAELTRSPTTLVLLDAQTAAAEAGSPAVSPGPDSSSESSSESLSGVSVVGAAEAGADVAGAATATAKPETDAAAAADSETAAISPSSAPTATAAAAGAAAAATATPPSSLSASATVVAAAATAATVTVTTPSAAAAATKLQALIRGKNARKAAQKKREVVDVSMGSSSLSSSSAVATAADAAPTVAAVVPAATAVAVAGAKADAAAAAAAAAAAGVAAAAASPADSPSPAPTPAAASGAPAATAVEQSSSSSSAPEADAVTTPKEEASVLTPSGDDSKASSPSRQEAETTVVKLASQKLLQTLSSLSISRSASTATTPDDATVKALIVEKSKSRSSELTQTQADAAYELLTSASLSRSLSLSLSSSGDDKKKLDAEYLPEFFNASTDFGKANIELAKETSGTSPDESKKTKLKKRYKKFVNSKLYLEHAKKIPDTYQQALADAISADKDLKKNPTLAYTYAKAAQPDFSIDEFVEKRKEGKAELKTDKIKEIKRTALDKTFASSSIKGKTDKFSKDGSQESVFEITSGDAKFTLKETKFGGKVKYNFDELGALSADKKAKISFMMKVPLVNRSGREVDGCYELIVVKNGKKLDPERFVTKAGKGMTLRSQIEEEVRSAPVALVTSLTANPSPAGPPSPPATPAAATKSPAEGKSPARRA